MKPIVAATMLIAVSALCGQERLPAEAGDPLPAFAMARYGTTRWKQTLAVNHLAFSAQGKIIAVSSNNEGIWLHNAGTGKRLAKLPVSDMDYRGNFIFADDGKTVATFERNSAAIHLYDAQTGKRKTMLSLKSPLPAAAIQPGRPRLPPALVPVEPWQTLVGFALSPGAASIATIHWINQAQEREIRLWDVATGKELPKPLRGGSAVLFGPNGKTLMVGNDKRTRIWDIATRNEIRRLEGGGKRLAISSDGRRLAALGDEWLRLWNPETGELFQSFALPKEISEWYAKLALSSNGRTVALSHRNLLYVWEVDSGKELYRFAGNNFGEITPALSPDGRILMWGRGDSLIRRRDLITGRDMPIVGHSSPVSLVRFAPDGKTLVTLSQFHDMHLVKADSLSLEKSPLPFALPATSAIYLSQAAISPDGKLLAFTDNKCVRVHELATGKEIHVFRELGSANCLAFSPDAKLLAIGDSDYSRSSNPIGRLHVWELTTGRRRHLRTTSGHYPRDVSFSHNGKKLASATDSVQIWDAGSGKLLDTLSHRSHRFVYHAEFLSNSNRVICLFDRIRVWDLAADPADREVDVAFDAQKPLRAIAVDAAGKLLATGEGDNVIRLWDLATGLKRGELAGHSGAILSLDFSPDGKWLASGSEDTTILLWDLPSALRGHTTVAKKPADLKQLWNNLAQTDAAAGNDAMWALVLQSDKAVAFIQKHLSKRGNGERDKIATWVRQLGAREFPKREEASRELQKLGSVVVPILQDALKADPSAEARIRIQRLLASLDVESPLAPAAELQGVRSVEVLERIATPAARKLLRELGDGPPSRLTQHARLALARLEQRTGAKP